MAEVLGSTGIGILSTSCLECGAPVVATSRIRREYCSDECKRARKRRIRKSPETPKCGICTREFQRTSNRQKVCSECRTLKTRMYTQSYNQTNAEVVRAKRRLAMKRSREQAPEKVRERERRWRAENKEILNARRRTPEYREKARERLRRRYASDRSFAVHSRMASAIYQAIKDAKGGRKWERLVGYTLSDLCRHLERQFTQGMGWHNMGQWHIDHILPKASFNYATEQDEGFRACWALTNLRPLWGEQNQKKHAKRIFLL